MEFNNRYLFLILAGIISAFVVAWNNPLENWENYEYDQKIWTVFLILVSAAGFLALVLQILDLIKG